MRITGISVCTAALVIAAAGTPAYAAPAVTNTLVNVSSDGTPGDLGAGDGSLSADGRYAAFASGSTTLVPGDTNNATDIFVRDTVAGTTTLVSGGLNGEPANGFAQFYASISADGRYVAFGSDATNLVADDWNQRSDVFVHDRVTGTTVRASVYDGEPISGNSYDITISRDGRRVSFIADVPSLGQHAFVRDLRTGVTTQVSGGFANAYSVRISAGGRHVVLTAPDPVDRNTGVFVHDRVTGTDVRANESGDAVNPSISADGTRVTFETYDSLVAADTNGRSDVYLRDLTTGTTSLVSATATGAAGNSHSMGGRISDNGRHVAFHTEATDLYRNDVNQATDVLLTNLQTGRTRLAGANTAGAGPNNASFAGVPSANGSRVLFTSGATDLGPAVPAGTRNLYVRDIR